MAHYNYFSSGTFGVSLLTSDVVYLASAASMYSNSDAIFGNTGVNSMNLTLNGDLWGGDRAINLLGQSVSYDQASNHRIQIGASGNLASASSNTIFLGGSNNRVNNQGTITSTNGNGVQFHSNSGSGNTLSNSGTISSGSEYGVHFLNSGSSYSYGNFSNTGLVTGYKIGVYFENTIASSFINTGTIIGQTAQAAIIGGTGISYLTNTGTIIGLGGLEIRGGYGMEINNSGEIINTWISNGRYALNASAASHTKILTSGTIEGNVITGSGADTLDNTGAITGDVALGAVNDTLKNTGGTINGNIDMGSDGFVDEVYNSGTINGNISLGDGNDIFDGRGGFVSGNVEGGLGDDTYYVSQSSIALVENAAEGTDSVFSSVTFVLDDNIENLELIGSANIAGVGNAMANNVIGNAGNNWLRGAGGNDFMAGKSGDDVVLGGSGADTIYGGEDNDRLYGGISNDKLYGGNGSDSLHGGLGADILYGGYGADTFEFDRAGQSLKTNNDIIKDFELDIDAIDLSAFGLTFKTGGFSGAKEVLVTTAAGNNTVWIDTDGNGFADMKILVEGVTGLNVDDFIL